MIDINNAILALNALADETKKNSKGFSVLLNLIADHTYNSKEASDYISAVFAIRYLADTELMRGRSALLDMVASRLEDAIELL